MPERQPDYWIAPIPSSNNWKLMTSDRKKLWTYRTRDRAEQSAVELLQTFSGSYRVINKTGEMEPPVIVEMGTGRNVWSCIEK